MANAEINSIPRCDEEKRLQEDLQRLGSIRSNIIKVTETDQQLDTPTFLQLLTSIGQEIYKISWKESENCVRNKHGYRNRHMKEQNKKNKFGAKIEFEVLGHLKDLVQDENFNWLLTKDYDLVKASLKVVQTKIEFILAKKPEEEPICAENTGFLVASCAYYHDNKSLITLTDLLKKLNDEMDNLDLANKIHRYYLGYLLVKIGETAKEISDFLKPEMNEKKAEKNVTRFFFGKLGAYRQEIKNKPFIVYKVSHVRLLQMKLFLQEAIQNGLISFLSDIRTELLESLIINKSDTEIDYAESILSINEKFKEINASKNPQECTPSAFEQKYWEMFNELRITLENGLESDLGKKIKTLEKKKETLSQEKSNLEVRLIENPQELDNQIKMSGSLRNLIKPLHAIAIEIKNLLKSLKEEQLQALRDNGELKNDQQLMSILESIQKYDIVDLNNQEKASTIEKFEKIFLLKLRKYKEKFNDLITNFSGKYMQSQNACEEYPKIKAFLDNKNENSNLKLLFELMDTTGSTKDSKTIQLQLDAKKEEFKCVQIELRLTRDHLVKFQDQLQTVSDEQKDNNLDTKVTKILKKINSELQTLKNIQEFGDASKIEYARKMCWGFLGQYCKEFNQIEGMNEEMKKYTGLLQAKIKESILLRNEFIMHNSLMCDFNETEETLTREILMVTGEFEALSTVNDERQREEGLLELAEALLILECYQEALPLCKQLDEIFEGLQTSCGKYFVHFAEKTHFNELELHFSDPIRKSIFLFLFMSAPKMGHVYYSLKKFKEALGCWNLLILSIEFSLPSQLENFYYFINNRAKTNFRLEQYLKASEDFKRVFDMTRNNDSCINVAAFQMNIGLVNINLGKYEESLECSQKALEIFKRLFKGNHPGIATSLVNIADACVELGKHEIALENYNKALSMFQELYKCNHPQTASCLTHLGSYYFKTGRVKEALEALECHEKALVMLKDLFKDGSSEIADCLYEIGHIFNELGDYKKALENHKEALKMRQDLIKCSHIDILNSLGNVGNLYLKLGENGKALENLKDAFQMLQSLPDPSQELTANLLESIGNIYCELGNFQDSEINLTNALKVFKDIYKSNHSDTAQCLNSLGHLYFKLRKYPQALQYHQDALAMLRGLSFIENDPLVIETRNFIDLANQMKQYEENYFKK
jgi:tetratricopeptide (TPR) repeat protein